MVRQHTVFAMVPPELGQNATGSRARRATSSPYTQCIAWPKAARWALISGGKRSRTEASRANQWV